MIILWNNVLVLKFPVGTDELKYLPTYADRSKLVYDFKLRIEVEKTLKTVWYDDIMLV